MIKDKSRVIIFSCWLILITILTYLPALRKFYFFGEDFNYLAHTRYTLSLGSLWEPFYLDFYGGMWFRPLNTFFWYLTWLICGLNPFYHYLINIIILIVTALLLVKFAIFLKIPISFAYTSGLLFILNPLTSATFSYLSARSDMLGSLFALLALLLWLAGESSMRTSTKYLSYLSAFFSYLFKEMFLCLPFLILAFPVDTNEEKNWRSNFIIRLKRAIPFFFLAVLFLLWRACVLKSAGGYFYKRSELIYNVALMPLNILKTILLLPQMFFLYPIHKTTFSSTWIFFNTVLLLIFALWVVFLLKKKNNGSGKTVLAWFMLSLLPVIFYPHVLKESPRMLYFPLIFVLLILSYFPANRKFLTSFFFFALAVFWFLFGRMVMSDHLNQTKTYRAIQSSATRDLLPQIANGNPHQTIIAFGVPPNVYSLDVIMLATFPNDIKLNESVGSSVVLLGDRATYTGEIILPDTPIPQSRFADIFDFYRADNVLIFKDKNTISVHRKQPDIPSLFQQRHNPRIYNYDEKDNRFIEVTELFSNITELRAAAIKSFGDFGFYFGNGLGEWKLNEQLVKEGTSDKALKLKSLGNDPYMVLKNTGLNPKAVKKFRLKMRARKMGFFVDDVTEGQILWESPLEPPFGLKKAFHFPVKADGEWHEYEIEIGRYPGWYFLDNVTAIRIDPVSCKAFIEIATFEAVPYEGSDSR